MHNIATGAAVDRETALFLLSFQEIGASAKEKFVSKCIKHPLRNPLRNRNL